MNINDYIPGTAYLLLYRSQFKSENEWEKICTFLNLPTSTAKIAIDVEKGSYRTEWI